ncbi:MAG: hypothetical protein NTZ51_07220 [Proteobacteria bacterium]|nr:hypothetical protein [Pseudomonadota bacterium]
MKQKKLIALLGSILLAIVCINTAIAEDTIGIQDVKGKTYVCFFFTPLDIISPQVTFGETGGLQISSFGGVGFYVNVLSFFTGGYWALNATVGGKQGDLVLIMIGTTIDPYPIIVGTGIIVLEYSDVYPFAFSGFEAGAVE